MRRWAVTCYAALAAGVAVATVACGSGGSGGGGTSTSRSNTQATGTAMTVSGALGGKKLAKGVCAWVDGPQGRVEVWIDPSYGQGFSYQQDGTLEGLRAVDVAHPETVGELLFPAGTKVTVTGKTYGVTGECGPIGVTASGPITATVSG